MLVSHWSFWSTDADKPALRLGHCLRKLKELAPIAIALFPLLSIPMALPLASDSPCEAEAINLGPDSLETMKLRSQEMDNVIDLWGLRNCHEWQPLINGGEVCP